ncbi:MAG TPA: DUF4282 domain-containing protein [Gaiellaceae bacterium]|nr:DUF4282 domain-containing protein [Gaiellaceae bacterium]
MSDFMAFRWMLTPILIQIMFVVGSLAAIAVGFVAIGHGAAHHHSGEVGAGIALVLLGPIVVRLYAELLIVVFRINDSLTDIRSLAIWTAEREHEYNATTFEGEDD